MADKNRRHKRIDKKISVLFCVAGVFPMKWDMSIIENISAGGVRFIAPNDLALNDKILQLQIKMPELAPLILELEALVVDVKLRLNEKQSDVRAKFINISASQQKNLAALEKIIEAQEIKKK